jgi:hypothetical protein
MEGACNIMEAEKKHAVEAWKAAESRLETSENDHAEAIDDRDSTISQNRIDLKAAQELSIQLEREIVQSRSDKEADQKRMMYCRANTMRYAENRQLLSNASMNWNNVNETWICVNRSWSRNKRW